MASTAEEFRKRARKTVTLPSGLTVEIRKVWPMVFRDLAVASDSDVEEGSKRYATKMITEGTIKPKFSDREEDMDKQEVAHVKDLSLEDFAALAREIAVWSELITEDPGEKPPSGGSDEGE